MQDAAFSRFDARKAGRLGWAGAALRSWLDRLAARSSAVGDAPVFEPSAFPWTAELEAGAEAIRAEALGLLQGAGIPLVADISPDRSRLAAEPTWRSIFLFGYGSPDADNCARCPVAAELLARIPGLHSAFLSVLAPGARIPRHRGFTKSLITCHLGLIVPKDRLGASIVIHDRELHWREGECLVFDDTFFHEARNETDETRVVLLVQFERPMRQPGRALWRAAWRGFPPGGRRKPTGWRWPASTIAPARPLSLRVVAPNEPASSFFERWANATVDADGFSTGPDQVESYYAHLTGQARTHGVRLEELEAACHGDVRGTIFSRMMIKSARDRDDG